jgi:nucleotide-binding universal stress UspA family protein
MSPASCWPHKGRLKAKNAPIESSDALDNVRRSNMQPAWKILAPIELSINPEGPVEHAINIALAMGAELTLLYVVDQRWNRLGCALKDVLTDRAVHRLILPAGNPAETIARYAEFINADLLAMTSENYGRSSRFWKHSVTRDIIRCTRRPVCVTDLRSGDADYRFRCRTILCTLSLDGTDDQLLLHAQALAQRSGGDLILLGVVPEIDEGILPETIPGFDRPLSASAAVERIRVLGEGISVPYEASVMIGSPYNCIPMAAREHSADVVMAARPSQGQTESNYLDMRSVLRRLPCPLISVTGSLPPVRSITREREAAPDFEHASSF